MDNRPRPGSGPKGAVPKPCAPPTLLEDRQRALFPFLISPLPPLAAVGSRSCVLQFLMPKPIQLDFCRESLCYSIWCLVLLCICLVLRSNQAPLILCSRIPIVLTRVPGKTPPSSEL